MLSLYSFLHGAFVTRAELCIFCPRAFVPDRTCVIYSLIYCLLSAGKKSLGRRRKKKIASSFKEKRKGNTILGERRGERDPVRLHWSPLFASAGLKLKHVHCEVLQSCDLWFFKPTHSDISAWICKNLQVTTVRLLRLCVRLPVVIKCCCCSTVRQLSPLLAECINRPAVVPLNKSLLTAYIETHWMRERTAHDTLSSPAWHGDDRRAAWSHCTLWERQSVKETLLIWLITLTLRDNNE